MFTYLCCISYCYYHPKIERDLIMEVDRLKHRPSSKIPNRSKQVGSFESYVKNVEQQKEYYKREVSQDSYFI